MARDRDLTDALAAQVAEAYEAGRVLRIRGGDSKAFYGREPRGEPLDLGGHRGIVSYEPTELVLTARAGTPLAEIEAVLEENGQMLAFEPPHFAGGATLGGAVAAGLSGPRRAHFGAVRDMVLGVRCLNGRGQPLRFGGQVMKNVAGYDLSRLMAGALGTLGVLLEVSLKVLPRPPANHTLVLERPPAEIFETSEAWIRQGLPLSATAQDGDRLYVRLSGEARAVENAARHIGGDRLDDAPGFWRAVRDHQHRFFAQGSLPLWRLALPPGTPLPALDGPRFIEWRGMQCWQRTEAPAARVREIAAASGGHATLFRGGEEERTDTFQPLPQPLLDVHRRLKSAMDPAGILNPGRLYAEL